MAEIASGTEQNDWDLASSEQLEVDGVNTSFALTATGVTQIMVQLGNAANLLHASGGILAVTVKVTNVDTGDKCVMGQKKMNLVAGDRLALIACDPFWAKSGSTIEVHAKSSNAGDSSVGGKVWLVDVTAASGGDATEAKQDTIITATTAIQDETDKLNNMIDEESAGNEFTAIALTNSAAAVVTALMAHAGFTAGGTMTVEELYQLLAGIAAGNWRDKPADSTKQELLDADDDSTILLEITLATTSPYKQATIKI